MKLAPSDGRPAGIALCLIALFAMGGCAHFRNAEERVARERTGTAPAVTMPPAAAVEPQPATPLPPLPSPSAAPPPAAPPMPAPNVATAANPAAASPEASRTVPAAPDLSRPELALTAPPARPTGAPPPSPPPATDDAIIIFANSPGVPCEHCDTLKISVAPSGQVLIEHGQWAGDNRNWRYKRSVEHVDPARVVAFAAALSADRPRGQRLLTDSSRCLEATTEHDGLIIEWITAERHDILTYEFACPAGRHGPIAERLRHAPDLLGLHGLVWPDDDGQR